MTKQTPQRRIRRPRLTALLAWALAPLSLLPGCARYTDYQAFIKEPRPLVTSTDYRLTPPDSIAIDSKRVREINGKEETIRPDGKISLPLLGTYFIAGKTCEEASAELQRLAREYYDDADVSIRVTNFASKKVYVFGEVATPGSYPYNGANTVLDILSRAQPTRLAEFNRIQVLRPAKDGRLVKRMTIDLDQMIQKGDTRLDAVLEEGDILYIPPDALATVGLAFQQLLLPIQPAAQTVNDPASIEASGTSYGHGGVITGVP